ncbi:MAG TPA: TlpA disulfide reductase family protein [Bryobacteraceae bacterium]|nr:TlpA disulfide reductase family protein [Bryobacteraceae bacterium]
MEPGDCNQNNEVNLSRWVDEEVAGLGPGPDWEPDAQRGLALLRGRRAKGNGNRRRWTWVAAGAMATCLWLMAAPVTRAFAQRCLSACVSGTGWVTHFLTASMPDTNPSSVYLQPKERKMAPDFTLSDASGRPVRLSALRGDVVLLNFWATWCAPCKVEIPMFMGFQQKYRDRGFVVLGVALDEGGWSAVRPYAEAKKINYPVMVGNDRISDLFGGLKAVPTTFLIDRRGRVAAEHIGLCKRGEYEGDITAALNE